MTTVEPDRLVAPLIFLVANRNATQHTKAEGMFSLLLRRSIGAIRNYIIRCKHALERELLWPDKKTKKELQVALTHWHEELIWAVTSDNQRYLGVPEDELSPIGLTTKEYSYLGLSAEELRDMTPSVEEFRRPSSEELQQIGLTAESLRQIGITMIWIQREESGE